MEVHMHSNTYKDLPLNELRALWADTWNKTPNKRMGRTMLVKSLCYKLWEVETGGVPGQVQKRLDELIKKYKCQGKARSDRTLKVGTELVRIYQDKKHIVKVTERGLEYNGEVWSSLSAIATYIASGSRNGWRFFGIV
jgi:hypothetical protein